jgi:peptidoglycan/LPS O-acetylase OafA/YrhL
VDRIKLSVPQSYRPDIDGLRAIAVIPVVLFHAGVKWFSGGYVGVDVFFVISGFLITGILARSMQERRYSIVEFYQRRARRIFPALIAMTLVSWIAGYALLTPDEFLLLGKSILSIAGFVSNFYFWKSVGYFQSGTTFQPFLHTWSLAVEEQFYILFPVLLYFLHGKRKFLIPLLLSIFVSSLIASIVLVHFKPRMAFYLLPGRAWELMAGGILALGVFERFWSRRATALASLLGIALIGVPVFCYTDATAFPGMAAIPPVLGSCLLIWARGEGVGRILASKPMVAIGLVSYSLYLWHLPIFEFAKYLTGSTLSLRLGLTLSVAALAVSWCSLHVFEAPFRRPGPKPAVLRRAIVAWLGIGMIAVCGLASVVTKGMPWRMSPAEAAVLDVAHDEQKHHLECMSLDVMWIDPSHACKLGEPDSQPVALLWGDSHAMVTATAMEVAARKMHSAFLFAADADCPIGLGFAVDSSISPSLTFLEHYRRCAEYNRKMLDVAARPGIRTVVLSSRWTNWRIGEPANPAENEVDVRLRNDAGTAASVKANRAIFEYGFLQLLQDLDNAGKRVVIVGPLPEPQFNVPHRDYISRFGLAGPVMPVTMADYERRHAVILNFFGSLGEKAEFIWPIKLLCLNGVCPLIRSGIPLYFDHDHLSVARAKETAPLYESIFLTQRPSP